MLCCQFAHGNFEKYFDTIIIFTVRCCVKLDPKNLLETNIASKYSILAKLISNILAKINSFQNIQFQLNSSLKFYKIFKKIMRNVIKIRKIHKN